MKNDFFRGEYLSYLAPQKPSWQPNPWQLWRGPEQSWPQGASHVVVPWRWWQQQHDTSTQRPEHLGLWLAADDDPLALQLDQAELVVVCFDSFRDGRGYSHASLIRQSLAYDGPLWAWGEVLVDQLQFLVRVGFDGLVLAPDQDRDLALAKLSQLMPLRYQADARHPKSRGYEDYLWQPPAMNGSWPERWLALEAALRQICQEHRDIRLALSLGAEDVLLYAACARLKLAVKPFVLNTLRLHPQSLALAAELERSYGLAIDYIEPEAQAVAVYVQRYGVDGFYDSEEAKTACCHARKVAPLERVLAGAEAWITGLRREQNPTRSQLQWRQADGTRIKYSPLLEWTQADVFSALFAWHVPIHPLHWQGFPSLGCAPCTRAINRDEPERAGRWWWLDSTRKECGLHPVQP